MSVRSTAAKLGLVAATVSGLALTALGPAHADTVPGKNGVPGTYTLNQTVVGVGSDTIQWVDDALAASYNNTNPTVGWANFSACLGNTSAGAPGLGANPDGSGFPCGADNTGTKAGVKRDEGVVDPAAAGGSLPSGSGDGRTLLRTPADKLFTNVAYGRSSGPINTTDLAAGEVALPFAVDKIVVATQPGGPAPAALTGDQILKIYNGTYTNWNQLGGKKAPIHAYLPKAGSSTLNAFLSFLAGLDGVNEAPGTDNDPASHSAASQTWQGPGNTISQSNWNKGAANVEEHDPSVLIADPDAIEPFSYGRAQLANGVSKTVRIEGGWSQDRELYHVVRGSAISGAATTPFQYGADSGLLEGLFSPTGFVCTNAAAQQDISDAGFWPLPAGGTGLCGVKNSNTEDSINPFGSSGVGEGNATKTNASVQQGTVHVTVEAVAKAGAGTAATPQGSVQVVVTDKALPGSAAGKASYTTTVALNGNGKASVKLPKSVSGAKSFYVAYLPKSFGANGSKGHAAYGSSYDEFNGSAGAAVIGTKEKVAASPKTLANAQGKSKVTVTVKAASGSGKPQGKVTLMLGKTKLGSGALAKGKVTITVKGSALKKGKNKITVAYAPKGGFKAPKKAATVTITRTK